MHVNYEVSFELKINSLPVSSLDRLTAHAAIPPSPLSFHLLPPHLHITLVTVDTHCVFETSARKENLDGVELDWGNQMKGTWF